MHHEMMLLLCNHPKQAVFYMWFLLGNHPKQAVLTWPKKRNRRGLSLRFLVVIRQHLSDLVRGVIAQVV